MKLGRLRGILCVALVVTAASWGRAAIILSFQPDTAASPSLPELNFQTNGPTIASPPPSFNMDTGSNGNGDGGAAHPLSPGLTILTPLTINSPPGILGEQHNVDGSTTFYDVTLQLTGLAANAPAVPNVLFPGGTLLTQNLGSGTFTFSASQVGGGPGITLLAGTISSALLDGFAGSDSGSEISSSVLTYTGGAIYNQLIAQGGSPTGSESISLSNVTQPLSIDATTGYINDFVANATGQFSVAALPEPASLGLAGAGICCLLARRRSR